MKKFLLLTILMFLLFSCGSRKKLLSKNTEAVKTAQAVKSDSVVVEDVKEKIVETILTESEDVEYTFEPVTLDTTKPRSADPAVNVPQKIRIKTPNGKETEIEYPINTKVNVKSGTHRKDESKVAEKGSKKETEVTKDIEKKSNVKKTSKDLDVDRKEPFNLIILWIVLGAVVLIIVYLVLKRFKLL